MKNRFFLFTIITLCIPSFVASMDIVPTHIKRCTAFFHPDYNSSGYCGETVQKLSNNLLRKHGSDIQIEPFTEALLIRGTVRIALTKKQIDDHYECARQENPEIIEAMRVRNVDLTNVFKANLNQPTASIFMALPAAIVHHQLKSSNIITFGMLEFTMESSLQECINLRRNFKNNPDIFIWNNKEIKKLRNNQTIRIIDRRVAHSNYKPV